MSSWWKSTGYLPISGEGSTPQSPAATTRSSADGRGKEGGRRASVPEGWGIAYASVDGSREDAASVVSSERSSIVFDGGEAPKDAPHLHPLHHSEQSSERLLSASLPVQRWYRGAVAMVNMVVGACCVEVGLREEDSTCQATFGSLLVVAGVAQLMQCGLGVYLVLQSIGIEGEEPRTCLLLLEFIIWVFVVHELLLDSCENQKLPETATVYIACTSILFLISMASWVGLWIQSRSTVGASRRQDKF